ncbi:MAG: septum formation initiator family protein [Bacteroidetes bacterium]|nr:septum formation initiator family protein [Bacteroidota bacterium]
MMWKAIQKKSKNIPALFKNPYFIAASLFVAWMIFFDENNVANQYRLSIQLSDLREKKLFFVQQIAATDKAFLELTSNPQSQEKFAREHYWMKKDNEDVFVIVDNQSKN